MKPSKVCTSALDVGLGMFFMAETFSGSGFNPSFEITWPMNFTSACRSLTLFLLSFGLTLFGSFK